MTTLDVTRSIEINASVDRIWAALTEPDLISQWFGDTTQFDATPGGSAAFGWNDFGTFRAIVEHVDKPKTLVYRWARDKNVDPVPGNSTVVRFDLEETGTGTRLTVIETGFEELRDPQAVVGENTEG